MKLCRFASPEELTDAVVALLARHLAPHPSPRWRAVMLSGGRTPLPAYRALAAEGVVAAPELRFLLSDERYVPPTHPDSNFRPLADLFTALSVPGDRLLRVNTSLPLDEAAEQYHRDLQALLQGGAHFTVGLLGLGADGHTASLFSPADVRRGAGRLAVAVRRPEPPHRISVTPGLLQHVEEIVFLVAGSDKTTVVQKLLDEPESLPAGLAVAGCRNVSVWTAATPMP